MFVYYCLLSYYKDFNFTTKFLILCCLVQTKNPHSGIYFILEAPAGVEPASRALQAPV